MILGTQRHYVLRAESFAPQSEWRAQMQNAAI
jgi:hypothetical protein